MGRNELPSRTKELTKTFRPPIPSLRKRKEVQRYINEYAKPRAFRAVERINTAKKLIIKMKK